MKNCTWNDNTQSCSACQVPACSGFSEDTCGLNVCPNQPLVPCQWNGQACACVTLATTGVLGTTASILRPTTATTAAQGQSTTAQGQSTTATTAQGEGKGTTALGQSTTAQALSTTAQGQSTTATTAAIKTATTAAQSSSTGSRGCSNLAKDICLKTLCPNTNSVCVFVEGAGCACPAGTTGSQGTGEQESTTESQVSSTGSQETSTTGLLSECPSHPDNVSCLANFCLELEDTNCQWFTPKGVIPYCDCPTTSSTGAAVTGSATGSVTGSATAPTTGAIASTTSEEQSKGSTIVAFSTLLIVSMWVIVSSF